MTFGQLRTFLAVVRAGSIHGAATALFVSEPSVSAGITALEKHLRLELFERHGRGIRLTQAGEAFARAAAEALGTLEQGVDAARHAADPGTGRLRLAAVTTAGEVIVPPALQAFGERHPRIEPVLEVGNRALVIERVAAREADLGIGGRPPPGSGLTGTRFLDNPLILVAAAAHPLTTLRTRIDAAALSDVTWLVREPGSGTRTTTEDYLREREISPRAMLTLGSNGAVRQAAVVGLGVTLISAHAVASDLRSGALAQVRAPGLPLRRAWFVLQNQRGALPPSAALFLAFLGSAAGRRVLPSTRGMTQGAASAVRS